MEKGHFIEKVVAFNKKHNLLSLNDNILVTLSGGADSVALLLALRELGVTCVVAHCNFHLRGEESMRDETFVRTLTRSMNIKCFVKNFNVPEYIKAHGVSVEMACRELRYKWFEKIRQSEHCAYIAVAHHRDDNIETFFINLLRGTGIAGLAAIKPKNGYIIRPLLSVTRTEIEEYLSNCNIHYVIDSTNAENHYTRNKIRNIILPIIRNQFPDADTCVSRTIDNMYTCNIVYQNAIETIKADITVPISHIEMRIDMNKLCCINGNSAVLYEMLKVYGFNFSQIEEIITASQGNGSGKRFLTEKFEALINHDFLDISALSRIDNNIEVAKEEYLINLSCSQILEPIHIETKLFKRQSGENINLKATPNVAFFNIDILNAQLSLRHWKQGDSFTPFGMHGKKKLSDLFSDLKLSVNDKKNIWVLTANNQIVWVIGLRASNLYMISATDNQILRIECFLNK